MLKLIFSDLDNTLLNSNKTISDDTLNFLKDLKDIRFIVNSGRLPYNMESIKEYIDLSNIVCGNGSYIVLDGKLIYSCCLDKKDAYILLDYAYSKDYSLRLYLDSGLYIAEESKLLNIKPDEVLAIGDNENDLSMFKRGYHSACPSNACDKVKSIVEYVSPFDCNHDSMVDIIKQFL